MDPRLLLALVALAWLAAYLVGCRVWPYAACLRCKGEGKFRSPSGHAWRVCPRCKGTARRLRTGRRIINYYSDAARRTRT